MSGGDSFGAYLIIPLTQGCVAWVSPEDYPALASSAWRAKWNGSRFYAVRWASRVPGAPKRHLWMHRVILAAPAGLDVDHREHHPDPKIIDNRRFNLRLATRQQNQGNRSKSLRCSSLFKGVFWHRRERRWRAQIRINGARVYLGEFTVEAHAALAYDLAAVKHFGASFALTNFPVPGTERWLFGAEA